MKRTLDEAATNARSQAETPSTEQILGRMLAKARRHAELQATQPEPRQARPPSVVTDVFSVTEVPREAKRQRHREKVDDTNVELLAAALRRMPLPSQEVDKAERCALTGLDFYGGRRWRPYQLRLLSWMERMPGGLICAKMGLGKTLVGIARCLRSKGPCLIIATSEHAAKTVWAEEAKRTFNVHLDLFDCETRPELEAKHILMTTYDTIAAGPKARRNPAALFAVTWEVIVADESHKISNPKTRWARAAMNLKARAKFGLSGTPAPNRLRDARTQLTFMLGQTVLDTLSDMQLSDYIFAIDYKAAHVAMPEKHVHVVKLEFKPQTRRLYEKVQGAAILPIIRMTLARQVCVAPYVAAAALEKYNLCEPWVLDREGEAGLGSSKLLKLKELILDICVARQTQLLVVCTFAKVLRLAKKLAPPDLTVGLLCDSTPQAEREQLIRDFKGGQIALFLMTYKLGAECHNFQNCKFEVLLDLWWTEAATMQAEARTYRSGQTADVTITRLTIPDTIDDYVERVANRKGVAEQNMLQLASNK